MTSDADTIALLERALDQTAGLIAAIDASQAGRAGDTLRRVGRAGACQPPGRAGPAELPRVRARRDHRRADRPAERRGERRSCATHRETRADVLKGIVKNEIAWLPFHLWRMDMLYEKLHAVSPVKLEMKPSDFCQAKPLAKPPLAVRCRLVVPAGRPGHFRLTSATVMNSFFVPQLGSQIYTMAGMTTQLHLQADKPGTYPEMSAQFSGDGFSDMRFNVEAMPEAQFRRNLDRA